MNKLSLLISFLVSLLSLLHTQVTIASCSLISPEVNHEKAGTISIGAIFDETSRPGKEARVAVEMVVHDFNSVSNQHLLLRFGNSQGKPVRAALSGKFFF